MHLGQLVVVSVTHLEDTLGYDLLANAELLRPTSWVEETLKVVDSTIYISLPEMGSIGDARVLSIHSSTIKLPDSLGSYRPVTGKFIHVSNIVWELTFEGMEEPLGVTSNHPIWSNERQRWVEAGELEIGEEVKTQFGTTRLLSKQYLQGEHRVYNIEVHDAHNYFVSKQKVLAHNTDPICPNLGNLRKAITTSLLPDKGGKLTKAGRALQKHSGRGLTDTWLKNVPAGAKKNHLTWNKAGIDMLKEIMRADTPFVRNGAFIEKWSEDGLRGIRIQQDWQFKTFLDK